MDVPLQGKHQVSKQSLVHDWPFELWDAEHCGAWARAELMPLFLHHWDPRDTRIHSYISICLSAKAAMQALRVDQLIIT